MTHTIPNFEYTVYTPEHPTQQALVLMIHGFATRGDQLCFCTALQPVATSSGAVPGGCANTCAQGTP